jgi:methyltransferase (TIGR00027 family)
LTFAPVDFERQSLHAGLAAAGFDPSAQTFFTWLGVVPYLSGEAIWATLGFIAGVGGGAHVVFDYSDPPETLSAEMRALHDARAARVEAAGEAWVSYFEADKLRERLMGIGFREVEDLGPAEIAAKYFPERARKGPNRGGHIVRAGTI